MSISQEQLQKIAEKLSKIPGDNEKLLWNITDIISYMDMLSEIDTTWVSPTISVVENTSKLREDTLNTSQISPKELLECSNQKVIAGQIVLPNIMK